MLQTTQSPKKLRGRVLRKLFFVIAGILSWQITASLLQETYLLPAPMMVVRELRNFPSTYLPAMLITAEESVGGLIISILVGLALVLVMYRFPKSQGYVIPIAIILKATPIVAVAPMLVVWCSPGMPAKLIMAFLVSFFPILQNVHDGVRDTPEGPRSYAHVLGATRLRELVLIRAPFAVPAFASALKVATPLSVVGAIVAEFVTPTAGLGRLLVRAIPSLDTAALFATVICVAVIGLSTYGLAVRCEGWAVKKVHLSQMRASE